MQSATQESEQGVGSLLQPPCCFYCPAPQASSSVANTTSPWPNSTIMAAGLGRDGSALDSIHNSTGEKEVEREAEGRVCRQPQQGPSTSPGRTSVIHTESPVSAVAQGPGLMMRMPWPCWRGYMIFTIFLLPFQ